MTSKDKILQAIKAAQLDEVALPAPVENPTVYDDPVQKFSDVAKAVGTSVLEATNLEAVKDHLLQTYIPEVQARWSIEKSLRIVSTLPEMENLAEQIVDADLNPHSLEDVDIAIMAAQLGVAENSALWVPETLIRVLPFICQHLVLLVAKNQIVNNMHQAYEKMGLGVDPFGAFIAGPSKTADIEQSLVLGAHGPRSLAIYLLSS
ncbi:MULTISPECIES: LutC/YkgG family protein [Olivibacter]|jgi:L-lactate dehydrogenase complex protein LldG|uniref:Lactate utilization protein B/C n=3 Tax=Sphingobacteriaceae TaxID=84566 RepID=F4C9U7_SPHS2|nr:MULTISPECIES: LUD domain-containing protein [Olivibacter]MCL4639814.1 LUD domain-containing protein [Olivibacter sp. UJ_SKK_5.1]MDM8177957.1 LUD domain-containing protein [Olivibacter sp. 47]MDX3917125.1 LUD domain-containing protein [Pseudosphingobacterium sp.]QEK99264.1 lactate utilization protein B/C [Olivibacter sp. LS-1]